MIGGTHYQFLNGCNYTNLWFCRLTIKDRHKAANFLKKLKIRWYIWSSIDCATVCFNFSSVLVVTTLIRVSKTCCLPHFLLDSTKFLSFGIANCNAYLFVYLSFPYLSYFSHCSHLLCMSFILKLALGQSSLATAWTCKIN